MSREAFWSMILLIGGGLVLGLLQVARIGEAGTVYTRTVEKSATIAAANGEPARTLNWTVENKVDLFERNSPGVAVNLPRTIGLWIAAILTLAVFSFLAGDNPAYKLAESIFVGVSAGYAMVVGFWDELVQNLFGKLLPATMQQMGLANLGIDGKELEPDYVYLVPLVMGVMMLWQLAPRGGWIARWPLAFFIGATAGIKMTAYFESDFLRQIQETLLPLVVVVHEESGRNVHWTATIQSSFKNIAIVVGVLASLTYFFFSVEHTGVLKPVTRLGVYVLMITFGAGFAYTVMGRIALLIERFEFLFVDWLWLLDPLGMRS